MKILITGGAGFIGRHVVKRLLDDNHNIWILDNLSNGQEENIIEFIDKKHYCKLYIGDIKDISTLEQLFMNNFDIVFHLAANINVQESIDNPKITFDNDVTGTFNILNLCKEYNTKLVFISTCMVYSKANNEKGINELHPTKPTSPYAGAKIAAENMVLSYYYTYNLPIVILRPFNIYGPFQKEGQEGGVVSIFIKNKLSEKDLNIYGTGIQTRDLLYVEDAAEFIVRAGYSDKVNGDIINAGSGEDISINDLAKLIVKDERRIKHIDHIHPQSEIEKLLCDYSKAKRLLNWEPRIKLEKGIALTENWLRDGKEI